MVFGAVLVVIGAILKFAVSASASGFSVPTVGLILLLVGIAMFVAGLIALFAAPSRRSVTREGVQYGPGGQERVVEQEDRWAS
jgi:hypothetical protein